MTRKLYPESKYPDGHASLAIGLNNVGVLLKMRGQYDQALPVFEQALAMNRKLYPAAKYPAGCPDLAVCLNNLGVIYQVRAEFDKAMPYTEQAHAIYLKLFSSSKYPEGNLGFIMNTRNLGFLLQARGQHEKALLLQEQAQVMNRKRVEREMETIPEAQALALSSSLAHSLDGCYSSAVFVPGSAAASYEPLWTTKGMVMRLLSRRHQAATVQRLDFAGSASSV